MNCRSNAFALSSAATFLLLILLSLSPLAHANPTTWTVNNPGDPPSGNASNCASGNFNTCTLRDAVAAAHGGDTIAFMLNFGQNTIVLGNGALTFSNPSGTITIDGTNLVEFGGQQVSFPVVVDGNHASGVFINNGNVAMHDLTIQNGLAAYGGGIANLGTLTLSNVTLSGNSTSGVGVGGGGGIYNQGTLTLTNCTLSGNSALNLVGSGGGIYEDVGSTVSLTNCTLSGNSASTSGGGIYNAIGTATLTNCTLSGNSSASSGNGIGSNSGPVNLTNTIVADGCAFGSGGFVDHGGNLDSGVSCGFGGSSKGNAFPLIGPLKNNGGPTQTMMPGPGSDAIDYANCGTAPSTDQRGISRPQAFSCDSGAVEVRPYTLAMSVVGSGTVSSATAAIPRFTDGIADCAAGPSGTCSAFYAEGAVVQLIATPATGLHVDSWSGDCVVSPGNANQATVTMSADKSCTATFVANAPLLDLMIGGVDGYARYGQMLTYTATLSNEGTADATSVAVDFGLSTALDAVNATWGCMAAGGAVCPASSSASMLVPTLPVGGTLTWTLHVAVLANTPDPAASVQASLNSVVQGTDVATLVIFRATFD